MSSHASRAASAAEITVSRSARRTQARRRPTLLAAAVHLALAGGLLAVWQPEAQAQGAVTAAQQTPGTRAYDIPAGPLDAALARFVAESGVPLAAAPELVRGRQSRGVRGSFSAQAALDALLAGSGLEAFRQADGSYGLRPAPTGDTRRETTLAPMVVTGTALGGSALTEGSGSYTTGAITIGKTPTSLRETPHSVSVLTRQRLDDQNLTDFSQAIRNVTGLTVGTNYGPPGSGGDFISARGYDMDFQADGMNMQTQNHLTGQPDLALYDRLEVIRGPAGLFKGAGTPGPTVNLVRKRAQAPFQVSGEIGYGSWDSWRGDIDVTGALTESGNVRGRLVAVGEDRGYWLDGASADKKTLYGTLEFDLTDRMTLSLGGTWQDIEGKGLGGQTVPRNYTDGTPLGLSRSTSLQPDWSVKNSEVTEGFLELEHRLDGDGLIKGSFRRRDTSVLIRSLYINGVPKTGGGVTTVWGLQNRLGYEDNMADVFISTPFKLLGKDSNFLLGADYRDSSVLWKITSTGTLASINVFSFDPSSVPDPNFDTRNPSVTFTEQESYGLYSQLRVKPFDPLTLIAGARVSWWESKTTNRAQNRVTQNPKENGELTPYGGIVFDLMPALSIYASYAEIFQPQTQSTVSGSVLEPRIGSQIETGVKGEFFDERLNAHAAIFRIKDENRALQDPNNSNFSIAAGKVKTEGFEAEISGQFTDRWSATIGYAYNTSEYLKGSATQTGAVFSTGTPRHTYHLWTYYKFPENILPGFELGGGVRGAKGYENKDKDEYTIASLVAAYQINKHLRVALNAENIFDEKYYDRFWGAPRNYTLTLRYQY